MKHMYSHSHNVMMHFWIWFIDNRRLSDGWMIPESKGWMFFSPEISDYDIGWCSVKQACIDTKIN